MKEKFSLQSTKDQAEIIALAFTDSYIFDLDSAIEKLSEQISQNPLSDDQLKKLGEYKQSKISIDDLQEAFDYLSEIFVEIENVDTENTDGFPKHYSDTEEISSDMTRIFSSDRNYLDHPQLKKYPSIRPDTYQALYDDIEKTGKLLKPILLFKDKIVDGRARYGICKKLEIHPIYRELECDEESLEDLMDSLHVHKRELTQSQRAILAFENLNRFEKKNDVIEEEKKKNRGKKNQDFHDSRKLAARYYIVSTGLISKAKALKNTKDSKSLYDRVRAGSFTLDFAMTAIKLSLDLKLLDFIDTNDLKINQVRQLVKIKVADEELYNRILASPEDIEKLFSIFSFKKEFPEIYNQLKAGEITLEKAKEQKKEIQENNSEAQHNDTENSDVTTDSQVDNQTLVIDGSLKVTITELAQRDGKTVTEFLQLLIEKYNKEIRKDK